MYSHNFVITLVVKLQLVQHQSCTKKIKYVSKTGLKDLCQIMVRDLLKTAIG